MPFTGIPIERLRAEVNTSTNDDPLLEEVILVSLALLNELADDADGIPTPVFNQAHLAVAVDMFNRRKAPNGVLWQQFDNIADGSAPAVPLRLSDDPLRAARTLLAPWLLPAIG